MKPKNFIAYLTWLTHEVERNDHRTRTRRLLVAPCSGDPPNIAQRQMGGSGAATCNR